MSPSLSTMSGSIAFLGSGIGRYFFERQEIIADANL
jgi:hypothetical protein